MQQRFLFVHQALRCSPRSQPVHACQAPLQQDRAVASQAAPVRLPSYIMLPAKHKPLLTGCAPALGGTTLKRLLSMSDAWPAQSPHPRVLQEASAALGIAMCDFRAAPVARLAPCQFSRRRRRPARSMRARISAMLCCGIIASASSDSRIQVCSGVVHQAVTEPDAVLPAAAPATASSGNDISRRRRNASSTGGVAFSEKNNALHHCPRV